MDLLYAIAKEKRRRLQVVLLSSAMHFWNNKKAQLRQRAFLLTVSCYHLIIICET